MLRKINLSKKIVFLVTSILVLQIVILSIYNHYAKKQIIETKTVIDFFNKESGIDLTSVFQHYLTTTKIPKLVLSKSGNKLNYKWENVTADFKMPVDIIINEKTIRLQVTTENQELKVDKKVVLEDVTVKTNQFYIKVERK